MEKKMKKLLIMCLVCFVTMTFASTSAFAASAKASAQFLGMQSVGLSASIAETGSGSWTPVFTQVIHTAQDHDIYISPSFEVGLTTNTAVMSRKLARAIANAEAQVKVRVMVDDGEVAPGEVIYSKREQTLIAEFAGLYNMWDSECVQVTTNTDGLVTGIAFSDENTCFDAEYLQLILSTMAAHTFNFIATDVPAGDHTVQVQVMLDYDTGDGIGIYDRPELADELNQMPMSGSNAWIGKGSVLIDVVRMVKGEDVIPMD